MVYVDAEKLYAEVREDVESLLEEAFDALFHKSAPVQFSNSAKALDATSQLVGFNTTFFPRRDVIKIPLNRSTSHLKSKIVHTSKDGSVGYALMDCSASSSVAIPRGLYADCMPATGEPIWPRLTRDLSDHQFAVQSHDSDHFVLKNSSVQLTISKGRITSLVDVQLE